MNLEQRVTELEERIKNLEKAAAATVTISLNGKEFAKAFIDLNQNS
jgi:hypothetical protein